MDNHHENNYIKIEELKPADLWTMQKLKEIVTSQQQSNAINSEHELVGGFRVTCLRHDACDSHCTLDVASIFRYRQKIGI